MASLIRSSLDSDPDDVSASDSNDSYSEDSSSLIDSSDSGSDEDLKEVCHFHT